MILPHHSTNVQLCGLSVCLKALFQRLSRVAFGASEPCGPGKAASVIEHTPGVICAPPMNPYVS
jgi:hypothetical protein